MTSDTAHTLWLGIAIGITVSAVVVSLLLARRRRMLGIRRGDTDQI